MPKEKYIDAKKDIIAFYIGRPVSDFFTYVCLKFKIRATSVSKLSCISTLAALLMFVFVHNKIGAILGYFFVLCWDVMDGIDGTIARYTDTCSQNGELWDAMGGYLVMPITYLGMGIVAFYEESLFCINISKYSYLIMGGIAAVCSILPRLLAQKKSNIYGNSSINKIKDKSSWGFVKIFLFNVYSIPGVAGLLFIIAIVTNTMNIYTVLYTIANLFFTVYSSYSLLKD